MKKGQNGLKIILVLLGIVVIICIIAIIFTANNLDGTGDVIAGSSEDNTKNCRDVQVSYEKQVTDSKTVQYTEQECESKDLPYNIANFVLNSNICNENKKECKSGFMGIPYDCIEYCVDKTISCSLDLKNLDNEKQGSWTIKFNFYDTSSRNTIIAKDTTLSLYPQTQKTFVGTARITSQGADGNADKDIGCNYVESSIPTKQVCRDVIKYKEVPETKTIIEYKTEEQCD